MCSGELQVDEENEDRKSGQSEKIAKCEPLIEDHEGKEEEEEIVQV